MSLALGLTLLNLALSLLSFARAKNVVERAINFDLCFLSALAFVTLAGVLYQTRYYFDFLLFGILLSFIGSVLIIKHEFEGNKFE